MLLSTNFEMKFEVKINALPAAGDLATNILDVNQKFSPELSLFKVYLSSQNKLSLIYNGVTYVTDGPPLDSDRTKFTIIKVSQINGIVSIWSGETPTVFYNYPGAVTFDAPNTVYNLYISATADGITGGKIKRFVITCKIPLFTCTISNSTTHLMAYYSLFVSFLFSWHSHADCYRYPGAHL